MSNWINLLEVVYPIGSIYQSTKSTSPSQLIGGTWEQITEKFLFAAGENYTCGQTGGEEEHTLTTDEIPSHNHDINLYYHSKGGGNRNVNRSQWSEANDSGGRFITGGRGGGNLITICLLTKQFLFGKEQLNSYFIKFLMGTLFIKSTLFSIWSYSMNF